MNGVPPPGREGRSIGRRPDELPGNGFLSSGSRWNTPALRAVSERFTFDVTTALETAPALIFAVLFSLFPIFSLSTGRLSHHLIIFLRLLSSHAEV